MNTSPDSVHRSKHDQQQMRLHANLEQEESEWEASQQHGTENNLERLDLVAIRNSGNAGSRNRDERNDEGRFTELHGSFRNLPEP